MKVFAIRYGKNFKYGTAATVFQNDVRENEMVSNFSFFYYVIEFSGRYFLVDTGFHDTSLAADMGVDLIPIAKEVEMLFGDLCEIDTIFLTHSHWDHINNLPLYKPKNIVMAKNAYTIAMESGTKEVKSSLANGEIILVDKEYFVSDKFLFRVIGGHTPDSSVIFFEEGGVKYVITGDECYVQDNVFQNIPIGICDNPAKNEEFVRFCHEEGYVPLPFHDGGILKRYDRVSENIVRII